LFNENYKANLELLFNFTKFKGIKILCGVIRTFGGICSGNDSWTDAVI